MSDDDIIKFQKPKSKSVNLNTPAKAILPYSKWINDAYLTVIKQALTVISASTYHDEICFEISFLTNHPSVEVPAWLASQFPDTINVILNLQFENLVVYDDTFAVTLYFKGKASRLVIPFGAITIFRDAIADFTVGFGDGVDSSEPTLDDLQRVLTDIDEDKKMKEIIAESSGKVLSFDDFRNKKD